MAIVPSSSKDVTFTFNGTNLSEWVTAPPNYKLNAAMQTWTPPSSAFPTTHDTGQRSVENVQVTFIADGAAGGPNLKCATGTSSTMTTVIATGQSIAGTFVVASQEVQITDGDTLLVVEFFGSGTITWDLAT